MQTPIEGVLLVKPKIWGDARGYFVETWQQQRYEAAGICLPFVQDNHSMSTRGILRGLHYQKARPQGKLVCFSWAAILMWPWIFAPALPRLESGLGLSFRSGNRGNS